MMFILPKSICDYQLEMIKRIIILSPINIGSSKNKYKVFLQKLLLKAQKRNIYFNLVYVILFYIGNIIFNSELSWA